MKHPDDPTPEPLRLLGDTQVNLDELIPLLRDRLGLEDGDALRLTHEVVVLRAACEAALAWISNMRIVPGGDRHRLQTRLLLALGKAPHP
jgi:hypothetical protein